MTDNLPVKSVKSLVARIDIKKKFEDVLAKKAAPFLASLNQLSTANLMKCDPMTVVSAGFTAACLDLPIDKNLGFAHIVPYGDEAQFQMGYKGFIQLAMRTGQYAAMNAIIINEEAFISYNPLTGDLQLDIEKLNEDSPNICGYAFYFRLVSGFERIDYWSKDKVFNHAKKYSQAYRAKKKSSPWFTNPNKMALKTVIKNSLATWGILSVEMQTALRVDQSVQRDMGGDPEYIDNDIIDVDSNENDKPFSEQIGKKKAAKKKAKPADKPTEPPKMVKYNLSEDSEATIIDMKTTDRSLYDQVVVQCVADGLFENEPRSDDEVKRVTEAFEKAYNPFTGPME